MGTTTTHLALAAATATLLVGLVVFDRRTGTQPAPVNAGASPGPRVLATRDGADRKPGSRDAARIEGTARTFLAAYLPYTHNRPDGLTELPKVTADPALVARLLAAPPHGRPSHQKATVTRIAAERLTDRQAIVVAHIWGDGAGYAVALNLTHRAGQWTVTDTRPAG